MLLLLLLLPRSHNLDNYLLFFDEHITMAG